MPKGRYKSKRKKGMKKRSGKKVYSSRGLTGRRGARK